MTISETAIRNWDEHWVLRHITGTLSEVERVLRHNSITTVRLIDIGSNSGRFTEELGKSFDVSYAMLIEPIDSLLEFSRARLGEDGYTYVNCAVSNYDGEVQFCMPFVDEDSIDNNLGIGSIRMASTAVNITVRDCGTLLEEHLGFTPNLIKIDAEGEDTNIVKSLSAYIRKTGDCPIIVYESAPGRDAAEEEAIASLLDLGYEERTYKAIGASGEIFLMPAWSKWPE